MNESNLLFQTIFKQTIIIKSKEDFMNTDDSMASLLKEKSKENKKIRFKKSKKS